MTQPHHYPPGVPCWVDTWQPDPQIAARFYGALLGWEFDEPRPMPGGLEGSVPRCSSRRISRRRHWSGTGQPDSSRLEHAHLCREHRGDHRSHQERPGRGPRRAAGGWSRRTSGGAGRRRWGRVLHLATRRADGGTGRQRAKRLGDELVARAEPRARRSVLRDGVRLEARTLSDAPFALWRLPGYIGGENDQPMPRDVVAVMTPIGGRRGDTAPLGRQLHGRGC